MLQPNELELLLSYGMSDELALFEQPTIKEHAGGSQHQSPETEEDAAALQNQIHQLLSNEISGLDDWSNQ